MKHFGHILVAIDVVSDEFEASEGVPLEAASALREVVWAQEQSGARLTLITVIRTEEPLDAETREDLSERARARLETFVVPLLDGKDVDVQVAFGRPSTEIIRYVVHSDVDLVVVASSSRLHRRASVGSAAMRLLRQCPCPVWIAPRRADVGPRVVLSAVGLHDLTPRVLELSASIVAARGGQWHIFHVPEYPAEGGMRLRGVAWEVVEAYEAEVREKDWEVLHKLTDPLAQETGVTPELWMAEGLPSEQIARAVHKLAVDIVVMGTIGRSGLAGVVMGNTAEKVFAEVECSVVAVKPAGFETDIPV